MLIQTRRRRIVQEESSHLFHVNFNFLSVFMLSLRHNTWCTAAAAAAKSLQSCPTPCDPIDGSPPGSPVPGILQQEHWSGLPFPSSMHESEKWKWSCSVVSDSERLHGLQATRLLRPWDFPGKSTGVGCHCLLQPGVLPGIKYVLNEWIFPIPLAGKSNFGVCLWVLSKCTQTEAE